MKLMKRDRGVRFKKYTKDPAPIEEIRASEDN